MVHSWEEGRAETTNKPKSNQGYRQEEGERSQALINGHAVHTEDQHGQSCCSHQGWTAIELQWTPHQHKSHQQGSWREYIDIHSLSLAAEQHRYIYPSIHLSSYPSVHPSIHVCVCAIAATTRQGPQDISG